MDTSRSISSTSLRQVNDRLFNHSVHLSSMARTFRLDTSASPSWLLAWARKAASENGVKFVGDERSGRFSHDMMRGEYRMIGRTVIVTITYKHRLLLRPMVKSQLRSWFSSVSLPRVREESTAGTVRLATGRSDSRGLPRYLRRGLPRR
jgi:hypothetical protein